MYGKGGSYNLFAGKDASKALGKSSLKEDDASPDYSDLPEAEMKVLNDWPTFPQLIVKGEFVGGLDVVKEMVDNGELKELLAA